MSDKLFFASARVGILGAGLFGTALGSLAASSSRYAPLFWARTPRGQNQTTDMLALQSVDTLIYAVKAQAFEDVLKKAIKAGLCDKPLLIAAKGLLSGPEPLLCTRAKSLGWRAPVAVLSGPGFAADILAKRPFAVTIASELLPIAEGFCQKLASNHFRPYASRDPLGVSLAGAMKNPMAIACGLAMGFGLGESARAALMTRGLSEILRLGQAMGGKQLTFMGLSGMGDLALSCTSMKSRNFACGFALGQGQSVEQSESNLGTVEGLSTTKVGSELAQRYDVDMPVIQQLQGILDGSSSIAVGLENLMSRNLTLETSHVGELL